MEYEEIYRITELIKNTIHTVEEATALLNDVEYAVAKMKEGIEI